MSAAPVAPVTALDLSVGQSFLSSSQKTLLVIKFLHFFLYNTGQFPDFKLLTDRQCGDSNGASSSLRNRKLESCIASVSSLEKELCALSAFPIDQFLLILGPNIQKPIRMILLNFHYCDIVLDSDDTSCTDPQFPSFFKNLIENPHFDDIFKPAPLTRLHTYFRATRRFRCGDFIPKADFKPKGLVHVLNIVSVENTMELSTGDATTTVPHDDTHDGEFFKTDAERAWFSCSKIINGC